MNPYRESARRDSPMDVGTVRELPIELLGQRLEHKAWWHRLAEVWIEEAGPNGFLWSTYWDEPSAKGRGIDGRIQMFRGALDPTPWILVEVQL